MMTTVNNSKALIAEASAVIFRQQYWVGLWDANAQAFNKFDHFKFLIFYKCKAIL